ncbi:M56 family metallopeptidase [Pedobacter metabolipauper]|uniref:Beta-lactamase regulating signal transducer with metallopeptidase domain n=1 Tax=Pedobacter metabolipauper TaxID=425513 RepID=A0A4R6STH8_9SPHI|nr:M56 family metallopeptidase [Pedobacter metabolipauper]TDQ07326.1 beta-lactamase regulating signal transducer with metallopeptidase domain [Pedobacter metabolipauper]
MEAIVNTLIKATGWSIFHSLWQGAIIYAVLLIVVNVFPGLKAKTRHNLAYAAMSLIFIGFCITFFSIFKLPDHTSRISALTQAADAKYYQYIISLPERINSRTEHLFPYLVSVYTMGILLQLFILGAGYRKLLILKKAEYLSIPTEWQAVFNDLLVKLNLKQQIGFRLSSSVNVPLVIGYLKPIVLFPIALASQLDIKQVEAILIHELSHIRRNDYLLNLVKTAIETLLFFNPFIWLSGRLINIEREHACDDLVLKFTGTPVTYAHALLKLEILKNKTSPSLAMAANGNNQHLYQRIKRITDMKTNYMNAKQQFFAIGITIATVISLAWVNPSNTASAIELVKAKLKVDPANHNINVNNGSNTNSIQLVSHFSAEPDTIKKKKKIKIITTDADGNKQEYNSLNEMPDSLRTRFMNESFLNGSFLNGLSMNLDSALNGSLAFFKSGDFKNMIFDARKSSEELQKYFTSPEWKKQQEEIKQGSEEIKKHFNSPEWKKQQEDIRKSAEEIRKQFNSPEWKKQKEEMIKSSEEIKKHFNSPEWKKQQEEIIKSSEEIKKHFNSPEWKKQQEDIRKSAEEIRLQFNSPEFKKQIEDIKELQKSQEYKELKEKFDKDLELLKQKKGIKSDTKGITITSGSTSNN